MALTAASIKFLAASNHFMLLLITLEFFMAIILLGSSLNLGLNALSVRWLFLLIVLIVGGACFGLSLLVRVARVSGSELEIGLCAAS